MAEAAAAGEPVNEFDPWDGVPDWVRRSCPPLRPPADDGLAEEEALGFLLESAPRWHLGLAWCWDAYASTLDPTPSVVSVSTGVQSVSYNPASPSGPYGVAMARAAWHRGQLGTLHSEPLGRSRGAVLPVDWWQRNLEDA